MGDEFKINSEYMQELKSKQALLGCTNVREAANLLMSLGSLVIDAALKGGQIAIVFEKEDKWNPISHPALEHIKTILTER